jgi:hypothetical protein
MRQAKSPDICHRGKKEITKVKTSEVIPIDQHPLEASVSAKQHHHEEDTNKALQQVTKWSRSSSNENK